MPISIFKKGDKEKIDIQEVFNIWNVLRARYYSMETVKFFMNFVHDREFDLVLNRLLNHYETQALILEQEGKKFKIEVPKRPPYKIKTSAQVDVITDSYIFRNIYNGVVSQLFSLMTAYRSTTTNDHLRGILKDDLIQHLKDFEILYKYGKLKGWQEDPPAFKSMKPVGNEPLSTTEAFHLWDNISQRYQQSQLTDFFLGFAHDKDFRAVLMLGKKTLDKQARKLEEEAVKFEIALPERPPSHVSVPMDPEPMQDRYMFNRIFTGIQEAVDLHIRATIEAIRNDSLRHMMMNFWLDEIKIYEAVLKYGKMKGWVTTPPLYNEPQ
ncbi:DUF3231 family protein [Dethiobacter alkaliphilus]|uniref:DUF3231 family protein n=1 Tax=Dethiobacter alkaliphilus AHT 1 TaxID=555088 RepID=C0GJT9_DETAL|nr:DUF3231 family protein [Dethiobacter alkaliphilus]EEG76397.1 conserved hypothetical protein [Dethiobacter alkaliphilus AHT 1]